MGVSVQTMAAGAGLLCVSARGDSCIGQRSVSGMQEIPDLRACAVPHQNPALRGLALPPAAPD
jgi:hypothetical protein